MSVRFDDLELNFNVDHLTETLMEPSVAAQDGVGECSINEARVSEGKDTLIRDDGVKVKDDAVNLGLDSEVPKFDCEVNENDRLNSVEGSLNGHVISNFIKDDDKEKIEVSREDGPSMISLVVDLNSCKVPYVELKSENDIGDQGTDDVQVHKEIVKNNVLSSYVDECCAEKEGEYDVSDLVWGKVRSHPWWPGQIFDPSASSNKAMKYYKKDRFLIAYFGDQSFAWNEESQIKPFRMNFTRMAKQSNMESFCHAVDCALDEVSRRVEFGLACSCLSEEVYSKIKSQFVANAGIREESSRRDGGDRFSSVSNFIPEKLVRYLKALAEEPFGGTNRLEFETARAQLLAFNRWKGYNQLAAFNVLNGLLETDANSPIVGNEKDSNEVTKDTNATSKKKHKQISGDALSARKKEKRVLDLMAESCSSLTNGENKSKAKSGRDMSSKSFDRKRKAVDKVSSPPKKFTKIGERIRRVVSQLSRSTPILKNGDKTSREDKNDVDFTRVSNSTSCTEKSDAAKVVNPAEYPPVDEMLSLLYLAATDPMNGHSLLISILSFFSNFRNQVSLANSEDKSNGKMCDEQTGKNSSNLETTETSVFEGMEDSYWTDRIIQGNPDEQVLFEPEIPEIMPIEVLESGHKQENSVVNLDHEAEKKLEEYSPTALILNFSDLNSVPSAMNLNKIFFRYGPLNEMETEVMKKSSRAKVVFKRRCDAETAFSSAGKFSIFGPSLVSYRLNYSPTPRKASTPAKRNKLDANAKCKLRIED